LTPAERSVLERVASMEPVATVSGLTVLSRIDQEAPKLWDPSDGGQIELLKRVLEDLVKRDYLTPQTEEGSGEPAYAFKDRLERERIASRLAPGIARRYHQALADWLANRSAQVEDESYLATLGEHLVRAGSTTRAGLAYIRAGDLARTHYAVARACQYYARGLELLGAADGRRRIDALNHYGDTLMLLGRANEASAGFREMLDLSFQLDLNAKGGVAHNRMGRIFRDRGSLEEALEHFETAIKLFDRALDHQGVATCHDDVGKLLWLRGDYQLALERLKIALDMRQELGDQRAVAQSLHNLGVVWRDDGSRVQAHDALEKALEIQRSLHDQPGVAETLASLGRLAQDAHQLEKALSLFEAAYEMAKDLGEQNRLASLLTAIGEIQYRLKHPDRAIEVLKEAEELCDDQGDRLQLGITKRGLAKAYLLHGDLRKARTNIKQAVEVFGQLRTRPHLSIALRTLGEVTAAGGWGAAHEGRAAQYFVRSMAICRELGNDFELAKTCESFARHVAQSAELKRDPDVVRQAEECGALAAEIYEKLGVRPKPSMPPY
jgi:tetratricopeptide (TPR) repeat protein